MVRHAAPAELNTVYPFARPSAVNLHPHWVIVSGDVVYLRRLNNSYALA